MSPKIFRDQCGNEIKFNSIPQRIISLVPSQTELLFDLGLDDHVVGITKYCVHPTQWSTSKAIVGGTKKLNIDLIRSLHPDLIIANKEENTKADIEEVKKDFPVWLSDIYNLDGALDMIASVADMCGVTKRGIEIAKAITNSFSSIQKGHELRTLYMIWRKPFMAAGRQTFIHDMLDKIGLINVLPEFSRYPELKVEEIQDLKPDLVMLSSEPYPFNELHIDELKRLSPTSRVILVDGEMFSWYGSRLLKAPGYFNSLELR
jgi:ABC-type Fe3+-hydroxamate transport system substrate-binding protein